MKIGVISDTHLRSGDDASLLTELVESSYFRDVDLILHAGDHVVLDVVEMALAPKRLVSVRGNMDVGEAAELPIKRVVELAGKRIGLIHGWGSPDGLAERVAAEFADEDVDLIVFGHSHRPYEGRVGGRLLFNPGSPTDKHFAPYNSVGIIEITGGGVDVEVIRL
ncbi:MAG TPA: metallophosphoesterase [Proteobacteria bacterium]|nr:metallophosphoesterase [Pseudomonadota bacterium]